MTYPDGTSRKGTIKHQGCGVYDFVEHVGKAKDIIERQLGLPESPKWKDAEPNHNAMDAVKYTAYTNAPRIEKEYIQGAVQARKDAQNAGLARHYTGLAVDLKPLTIIPVIGEMGVTRSQEHDTFKQRMLDMLGPADLEHLSIRVDSRGILFESKEFKEIGMLCGFDEFETCAGNGSIDAHKLFLIVNTMRLDVIKRKQRGVRTFPDAKNMFSGEPEGAYAKCEYECNRILNLLGVSDVCVTVDKTDGRVMFYHRIYTGVTYTLNYAPTVSSKSVEAAVSTVRKGALAEQERRAS
jgi:hypothetical protein